MRKKNTVKSATQLGEIIWNVVQNFTYSNLMQLNIESIGKAQKKLWFFPKFSILFSK